MGQTHPAPGGGRVVLYEPGVHRGVMPPPPPPTGWNRGLAGGYGSYYNPAYGYGYVETPWVSPTTIRNNQYSSPYNHSVSGAQPPISMNGFSYPGVDYGWYGGAPAPAEPFVAPTVTPGALVPYTGVVAPTVTQGALVPYVGVPEPMFAPAIAVAPTVTALPTTVTRSQFGAPIPGAMPPLALGRGGGAPMYGRHHHHRSARRQPRRNTSNLNYGPADDVFAWNGSD